MSLSLLPLVAVVTLAAGVVQSAAGFGAGTIIMMVLPFFFGITGSTAINSSVSVFLTVSMALQYRKRVNYPKVLTIAVFYVSMSLLSISLTKYIPVNALGIAFGCFMVVLAVFFFFFADRIVLPDKIPVRILCGLFSGVCSGLFGVGGPLVSIYLMSTSDSPDDYLANTQMTFAIGDTFNIIARIVNNQYNPATMWPYTLAGVAGILLGKTFGLRLRSRISPEKLKLAVYIMVAVSGIWTVIKYAFLA